ncbi:oligosaccharide flippase family protein [Pseudozobellia thermophila]|uniref:Membrane protein involved in the export of O-antigen and teichoic acid n=1 Tax=Pseudozobellia thermophila TaxID=192903 RepID=A0A1M6I2C6_9FLAO|nr:oligosaccharide flippase family protein [Pseudozobellia thermophila]SHJ28602.1 Membrane protein involved in the export of O-antigen and teichoic acid [Pseudozobellia thermophila]
MTAIRLMIQKISQEQIFMLSVLVVNGGNYLYNLLLGRLLGPEAFSEAALLITLLLVLSFLGMTFQLAVAKFSVLFTGGQLERFRGNMYKQSALAGLLIGFLIIVFSKNLQLLFNAQSHWMFVVFGLGVPVYFFMSVNRGTFQGKQEFGKLSLTYQTEMWSRLLLTMALLYFVDTLPGMVVSLGILLSFLFGLFPTEVKGLSLAPKERLHPDNSKKVSRFLLLTACYELTQIIINNSDILMVKHYFNAFDAGLYASLALIGRVVYFVAWMFVMLLLPAVVQKHRDGEPTAPVLFKYVTYIALLSLAIVLACYLFPELIISLMFGKSYLAMSGLLWQYALATSLFAVSNIFAYYFLSLDHYVPVIISGVLGLSQIVLVAVFHDDLATVVHMQIIAMTLLLAVQVFYFLIKERDKSLTGGAIPPP